MSAMLPTQRQEDNDQVINMDTWERKELNENNQFCWKARDVNGSRTSSAHIIGSQSTLEVHHGSPYLNWFEREFPPDNT
jgi:hypothetical protein